MPLFYYFIVGIVLMFITLEIDSLPKNNENSEENPALSLSHSPPKTHKRECWILKGKDVNSFRLFDGYLNFRVKALSARLSFFSGIDSTSPSPTFEINLGTSSNDSVSAVHRYKNKYLAFITPKIIKASAYTGFWVHWDRNGNFAVGKEDETLPFMAMRDFGPNRRAKITQLTVYPPPMLTGKAKWLIQVPQDDDSCQMSDGNCDMEDITLPENYKSFCEYLQMPQKKISFTKPLNTCDGKSRGFWAPNSGPALLEKMVTNDFFFSAETTIEDYDQTIEFSEILTPIGGQPSKFKFQAVKDVFNFGVMAEKHAEIVFLESLKLEPLCTVVLAASEAPTTSSLWITGENRLLYDTPGVINKRTHNYFWVTWDKEGYIAMGYAGDTVPFMATVNPNPAPINYVAFTTFTPGSYIIEATNKTATKPIKTSWRDASRGGLAECAFVGGYTCDDCDADLELFCSDKTPAGSSLLYVARSPHHDGLYPGYLSISDEEATIVLDNVERKKDFYQVLVTATLEWVRYKPKDVPNALVGGITGEKEPLYICRAKTGTNCVTGYVPKSGQHCVIAFKGQAMNITKYDTLACIDADKCPHEVIA